MGVKLSDLQAAVLDRKSSADDSWDSIEVKDQKLSMSTERIIRFNFIDHGLWQGE